MVGRDELMIEAVSEWRYGDQQINEMRLSDHVAVREASLPRDSRGRPQVLHH